MPGETFVQSPTSSQRIRWSALPWLPGPGEALLYSGSPASGALWLPRNIQQLEVFQGFCICELDDLLNVFAEAFGIQPSCRWLVLSGIVDYFPLCHGRSFKRIEEKELRSVVFLLSEPQHIAARSASHAGFWHYTFMASGGQEFSMHSAQAHALLKSTTLCNCSKVMARSWACGVPRQSGFTHLISCISSDRSM